MPNIRVIYDNAADRASLVAASVAGFPAANMLSNTKSRVCRSADKTLGVNAQFASAEPINAVAVMYTNVSPTATMRVRATQEASITNLILYSEQFEVTNWSKTGGTVTANAMASPDGQTGGEKFVSNSSDAFISQVLTGAAVAGKPFTMSIWMKSTVARNVNCYFWLGTSGLTTQFSLTTAWQRFSITLTPATSGDLRVQFGGASSLASGSELHLWGAQVEQNSSASSYYPTTYAPLVRPLGFMDNWQTYQYDTGYQPAVLTPPVRLHGWTAIAQASAYAYGGGTNLRYWMPATVQAVGVRVDIADPDNLQGYVEASRLVLGQYWSPVINAIEGSTMSVGDTSKHFRTDAGDNYTDTGTRFRKQSIQLPSLNEVDRAKMWEILWGNGMSTPIFVSLYPANSDPKLEQAHEIYGKLVSTPVMGTPYFNRNSATIEIEEL